MVKAKEAALLFTLQCLNYLLIVVSFRAVAHGDVWLTASTDFAIASFSFFVLKRIAKGDDAFHQWAGYTAGGVVGSILGIWLSVWMGR